MFISVFITGWTPMIFFASFLQQRDLPPAWCPATGTEVAQPVSSRAHGYGAGSWRLLALGHPVAGRRGMGRAGQHKQMVGRRCPAGDSPQVVNGVCSRLVVSTAGRRDSGDGTTRRIVASSIPQAVSNCTIVMKRGPASLANPGRRNAGSFAVHGRS
jgi:hypothetical protein